MKFTRSNFARWLSMVMVVMLLLSFGWTGTGNAMTNAHSKSNVSKSLYDTHNQSKNKINQDLKESFKKHDQVTFLLKFKEQVNTKKVAEDALSEKQKKNFTTAKAELTKRSVIVSALRSKAQETQYNVKEFLKKQKKQGNVKNYRSYFIVNMMAVTGTKKVAEQLAKMGEIEKILPNRTRHLIEQPKRVKNAVKSATKKAKKANSNDSVIEPNIKHIGAPEAWNMGVDGTGIVIGSIDTGVDWDHPALKKKYRGYNPEDPDNPDNEMNWYNATLPDFDLPPSDSNGHGTHTMGTMLGSESDGSNQIGVAPGAKWIAANAFTFLGASDDDLLAAGQWMLAPTDDDGNPHPEMAPDVINNSWGGGAGIDEFYREMVTNWREAGIFPTFAAGNTTETNPGGPESVASPGNYPESFAVGATDNNDNLASFSLRGPSPYDEIKPEIVAPGVNIRSSIPGGGYDGSYNGTSMAAPAVSGTVALLMQADSSLSVNDLEEILTDSAKPLTDEDYPESPNNGYGHGGLQADNAVATVITGLGTIEGHVMEEGNEPIGATVTVTETGASTKTDPADGSYSLTLPKGNYTLKAETYGFYSEMKSVNVNEDETATADFTMQEVPKGTLEGTITNKLTGDPVKGATVSLAEDAAIKPVQTDKEGNYSLKAYEGDYTIHVSVPYYYSKDINVTIKGDETATQNVTLKPFIGTPGKEIGYDDGIAENAKAFRNAGGRWAVRMSLAEGYDSAMVTGGKFKFWNYEFPSPGGDQFQVEIWDVSDENGGPGKKLAGPVDATAIRDETKWTTVNLENLAVVVDGDFYLVYVQSEDSTNAPGLSTDRSSPVAHRGWEYINGVWSQTGDGNFMIRALVDYEAPAPEITSPKDDSYTNKSTITVTGKAAPDFDINLFNNDEKIAETSTDDDGHFSKDIKLSTGENKLTAVASTDLGSTEPSEPVTVTLDQDKPDLTISSPQNRLKTNKMVVKVKGTVNDTHLSWVKVNDRKAEVNEDGTWSIRTLLDNGKNEIKVVARDKANNRTNKTRTVFANFEAPSLSNLKPDSDKHLKSGQSVIISFDSEPGLDASFKIKLPLENTIMTKTTSINEIPMMETSPGHYIGTWTATTMGNIRGAGIEVIVKDDYGNVSKQKADGELYINE